MTTSIIVSRGVSSWQNYDLTQEVLGAENDHGDVLVVKSGTDFRDLSELTLEFGRSATRQCEKKIIKTINGKQFTIVPLMRATTNII